MSVQGTATPGHHQQPLPGHPYPHTTDTRVCQHLLHRTDGDASRTGDHDVPLLHVGPDLVQDEGDDVGLHSQEQDVTVPHGVLIASGEIHTHLLQEEVNPVSSAW